jgi:hypothetical protein
MRNRTRTRNQLAYPFRNMPILFIKDDDEDDGGAGGGASKQTKITALKAKYNGDVERALDEMFEVNARFEKKISKLTTELDTVKAKIPSDGSIVLTKEEAPLWESYKKLGTPDVLVPKAQLDDANAKIALIDTEKLNFNAARELGFKGTVFHDLVQAKGLHVEIKDENENGKAVKRVYVRPKADEKAPLVLATKHIETQLADYLPSLREKATPLIPNMSSAEGVGGNATSVVDSFLAGKKEQNKSLAAQNPLLTPTAPAGTN